MNQKYKNLDQAIEELLKSTKAGELDEELEDANEIEEPTKEVEEREVENTEEPKDEVDETEEDEVEEEPTEVDEVEDVNEDKEKDDGSYMELDEVVEEVTNRIMDNVKEYINELMENKEEKDIQENVEGLTGVVEKSLNVMKSLFDRVENLEKRKTEETENVYKSLNDKVDNLDKLVKSRRSVANKKDIEVVERFEKSNKLENLTKSQAAEILSKAYQAGNRNISLADITNAELGRNISTGALEALKNSLND